VTSLGYASCSSEDHYSPKLGFRIAFGRALSGLGLPSRVRTNFSR